MTRNRFLNWSMIGAALLLGCAISGGTALAWGPFAQQVIAHESGGPFRDWVATGGSGRCTVEPPEDAHFIFQAAMPKAWEYARSGYVKTSEPYARLMEKFGCDRGDDVQAQAWKAAQIAEIAGDDKFFHTIATSCHERWFLELMVDAVLHSDMINTDSILDRVSVSCRPKLTAQTALRYTKRSGGIPVSSREAMAMTYDQALAMLGQRVLALNKTFQQNSLENSSPALWSAALLASASEVRKRLLNNIGNPDSINPPMENQIERRGFEILREIGVMVIWSGTGGLKTSAEFGSVRHEIIVNDADDADKVVATFLKDKIWRMKTDPISRILCYDLLELMTEELVDWTPTPLDVGLDETF